MLRSTSSTSGKSDAAGPAGTSRAKVKYFPSSVQNGGALGLIFPDYSLFFISGTFPSPLKQEVPCQWLPRVRSQGLSSSTVKTWFSELVGSPDTNPKEMEAQG